MGKILFSNLTSVSKDIDPFIKMNSKYSFNGQYYIIENIKRNIKDVYEHQTIKIGDRCNYESPLVVNNVATYVGRIIVDKKVIDIVFSCENERKWLTGRKGHREGWECDYNDGATWNIIMDFISELDINKRSEENVVRHLGYCMNNENRVDGLIEGCWDCSKYMAPFGAKHPKHWKNTNEVYRQYYLTNKSIKYGQCWVFSECLNIACRLLGIPARVISATNSRIDSRLDNGIDIGMQIMKDNYKSFSEDRALLYNRDNMKLLIGMVNNVYKSSDFLLDCKSFYDTDDTIWNVHVWNEVYINGKWSVIDSTPMISSIVEDQYRGKKVLGICPVENIRRGYVEGNDFMFLNSSVNSPFRFWSVEKVNDKDIPLLHSIVYPNNEELSICIDDKEIDIFEKKKVDVYLNDNGKVSLIKENYLCKDNDVMWRINVLNNPIVFRFNGKIEWIVRENVLVYFQQVFLDKKGNIVDHYIEDDIYLENVVLKNCFLDEVKSCSFLIVCKSTNKWWTQLLRL